MEAHLDAFLQEDAENIRREMTSKRLYAASETYIGDWDRVIFGFGRGSVQARSPRSLARRVTMV